MSKEKRRVPKLRFPGFTEDWEQRKLDELTISIGDGLHGTPKYDENGSYYFINGNNLVDSKVSVTEETKKVAFEALSNDDRRLDSTSILMSINGTIGTLARYNNESIMLGKSVAYITPKNINRDFLFYQLQGNVIQSYFYKNLTGTTIKNLGLGTIKNVIVMSTLSEEESKIGQFFYKLDQYITLHQRKLNNLKLKKKALLQKLFPKNGERYPEIRFSGFTDAWEQRKLSEVTTCFDNLRVPVTASDRVPGKIPYYGANGIQDYVSGHTHSGEFVLIAEDGANDLNDYPIQYVNGAIWVNNHAHVIAGYKEKLENKFLSYSLKTVKMTTFIVGGGRSKLNLKALLEIPISMPNYDEQCVIGKFIETIDINITLHQRKLDHLQLQKKALLQQMFV